jgi:predicted acetyltransferase
MPDVEIRQISPEESEPIRNLIPAYAFGETHPPLSDFAVSMTDYIKNDQYFVLYEDGDPVATTANSPMSQNIRGQVLPMWGVWNVAVMPQARRKGYARQLIQAMLTATNDIGVAYSTLYPFRESFYQRMGYALFPQARFATIKTSGFLPVFKMNLPGTVRMGPYPELMQPYHAFLRDIQGSLHGMAIFGEEKQNWYSMLDRFWIALAEVDGEAVGGMLYRVEDSQKMNVQRFFYKNNTGKYLLLDWFARHVDQIEKVKIKLPPADHPELWLEDLEIELEGAFTPMGRVVNVLGMAGLPVEDGRFTVKVHDPLCEWNNGIFTFQGMNGKLTVTRAASADFELTIQGVSALVYGSHDPFDFAFKGWSDADAETLTQMSSVFPRMMAYLHETF